MWGRRMQGALKNRDCGQYLAVTWKWYKIEPQWQTVSKLSSGTIFYDLPLPVIQILRLWHYYIVWCWISQKRYKIYYIHSYNEILGTYIRPTEWCHFEWPWMTLSDLAKYSMTRITVRSLCDSWASCFCLFVNKVAGKRLQPKKRFSYETFRVINGGSRIMLSFFDGINFSIKCELRVNRSP